MVNSLVLTIVSNLLDGEAKLARFFRIIFKSPPVSNAVTTEHTELYILYSPFNLVLNSPRLLVLLNSEKVFWPEFFLIVKE